MISAIDLHGRILGFLDRTFFFLTYINAVRTSPETQYIPFL
jgi:hypothetical protein